MVLPVVRLLGTLSLRKRPVVSVQAKVSAEEVISTPGQPINPAELALLEQALMRGHSPTPTVGDEKASRRPVVRLKDWNEEAHPRAPAGESDGGQFTSGGGGGGDGGASAGATGRGSSLRDKPASAFKKINPGGKDTLEQFSDGKGNFTKERAALHEEINAQYMKGTSRVDNPTAVILGGGPGTGKSTLVAMEKIGVENTVHVNTDDIRAGLPELKEGKPAAFTHEEASHAGKRLQKQATDGGRNLLLDGTGDSSLEKLGGKVAVMRASGHKIVAEYVTTSVEIAQARADARAQRTGRIVPPTVLRETHAAVSRVFPEAVRQGLFDTARLWDASGPKGSKPDLVMSSVGKVVTIHNQAMWDRFLAKGKS